MHVILSLRRISVQMKYYVYIMTNKSRTLYTGVTNDLERRVYEHKNKLIDGFTRKYNITLLVWYEDFDNVVEAIEAEKKIKGWRRSKKIELVDSINPEWNDLASGWFEPVTLSAAKGLANNIVSSSYGDPSQAQDDMELDR